MAERGESLSERELDVLRRLAAGESNKAIAEGLSISPYTVKTHLRNIYAKLAVSTRTEAMTVALQQGLLSVATVAQDETGGAEEEKDEDISPGTESPGPSATMLPELAHLAADGSSSTTVSHHWRLLSVALLALFVVVAGVFIIAKWRGSSLAATTPEQFAEQPLGETRWAASRPMVAPQAGRAVVAIGLDVYILGGETAQGVTDRVQVFNTGTRSWLRATNKPTAVRSATAAELFGELYVPGGALEDGRATDIVEAYSPSQNAWRRIAPLPQPLADALAIADGGFLYVFGGSNGDGVQATAYVYDPAADSWRPLSPLPAPRAGATGGALTGLLYIVGGRDDTAVHNSCFTYKPSADSWTECPPMMQPRVGAGATVLLNKLYVIGGTQSESGTTDNEEIFDPNNRTWTVLNSPPGVTNWAEPGVVHVETRIYALGGRQGETLSDAVLVYSPLVYQMYIPAAPSNSED